MGNIHTSKVVDLRILVLLPFTYITSKKAPICFNGFVQKPPPPFQKVAVSHTKPSLGKRFPFRLVSSLRLEVMELCGGGELYDRWYDRGAENTSSHEHSSESPAVIGGETDSKILFELFTPILLGGSDIQFDDFQV